MCLPMWAPGATLGSARDTLDIAAREEEWRGIKVQGAEEMSIPARTEHTCPALQGSTAWGRVGTIGGRCQRAIIRNIHTRVFVRISFGSNNDLVRKFRF